MEEYIYGENREFGGEYFVWAKNFQISKKNISEYFKNHLIFRKFSHLYISYTGNAD